MSRRIVAGCMTGTSLDGLDAVLVEIQGRGLAMKATVLGGRSLGLGTLAVPLRALAEQTPMSAGQVAQLAWDFGRLHARAVAELSAELGRAPDLVCVHGQTVFHAPPLSWQLMQPAPIAAALRVPVVFDLRSLDVAAGGQGAPITPIADHVLFGQGEGPRCIVNLGGFCNVTRLQRGRGIEEIEAFDVCACNQLLDSIARLGLGTGFDAGGTAAATGRVHDATLAELTTALASQAGLGGSLGTGDELTGWAARALKQISAPDLAATACAAIARTIAARLSPKEPSASASGHSSSSSSADILLAGGGARNATLVREIRAACPGPVALTDAHGVPVEYREAGCFAVLGALCQDRVPITLARVTGCRTPAPIGGAWVHP